MKFRKTNERGFASEFYDTKQRMNDNFTKHFPWCFSVYYIHTETSIIPFHSSEKSSFAVCTWTIYFSHMKSAVRGNSFAYDILRYGFFMSMSQYETLFPFRFFFFYKPPSILVPVFLGGGALSRPDLASRRVVTPRSKHLPCGFLIILFFSVLRKLVRRGYQPHLKDFLLRMNFNGFFPQTWGEGQKFESLHDCVVCVCRGGGGGRACEVEGMQRVLTSCYQALFINLCPSSCVAPGLLRLQTRDYYKRLQTTLRPSEPSAR